MHAVTDRCISMAVSRAAHSRLVWNERRRRRALLCLNQLIGDVVVVVPTADDVFINFAQLATDE